MNIRYVFLLIGLLGISKFSSGQSPDWEVDLSQYAFRMTVSAVLEHDNNLLDQEGNKVALFVGEEIRGVGATDIFHQPSGKYLAIFQVASDVASGETMDVRFYLESGNEILNARTKVAFIANDLIGTVNDPVIFSDNRFPSALEIDVTTFLENTSSGVLISNLSTTDPDDVSHQYKIVSVTPAEAFQYLKLEGNQLLTDLPANFETVENFEVEIAATDPLGATIIRTFPFQIIDQNDAPSDIILSDIIIDENSPIGTKIGQFTTTDEDVNDEFDYEIIPGNESLDYTFFTIIDDEIFTEKEIDWESQSAYSLEIKSTDRSGAVISKTINLFVRDINEAPVVRDTSFQLVENTDQIIVGSIKATDPDIGQTLTFQFEGNTDELPFSINANSGEITLTDQLNFEESGSYETVVKIIDSGVPAITKTIQLQVKVTDINEAPTDLKLSSLVINENSPLGTKVGEFSTEDEDFDEEFSYEIVPGSESLDYTYFTIIGNGIFTEKQIDRELTAEYTLEVVSTDKAGASISKIFNIFIGDVNEPPIVNDTVLQVGENILPSIIGQIRAIDPDEGQSLTFEFAGVSDDFPFQIDANTGEITLTTPLNFELQNKYETVVKIIDSGLPSISELIDLRIVVTDINEAPTELLISNQNLNENSSANVLVGTLEAIDEDEEDFFEYTILSVNSSQSQNLFSLVNDKIFANQSFDFESLNLYELMIRATDKAGLSVEKNFTIQVNDLNEAPFVFDTVFSINETAPFNATVGQVDFFDEDFNEELTFRFAGDEEIPFTIDPETAKIFVEVPELIDYEEKAIWILKVVVADGGIPVYRDTATVIVEIGDVPESDYLPYNNYISPNGDQVNDFFEIENVHIYEGYLLKIFTPQGKVVYQNDAYDNSWDGRWNGRLLPVGTYYFTLESTSQNIRYSGKVFLKDR